VGGEGVGDRQGGRTAAQTHFLVKRESRRVSC
jgi:hypothetical protein